MHVLHAHTGFLQLLKTIQFAALLLQALRNLKMYQFGYWDKYFLALALFGSVVLLYHFPRALHVFVLIRPC